MRLVQNNLRSGEAGPEHELLDALVQGSPVATFVIDTNHCITHWNRACELMTGIPASEMVGTSEHWRGFYEAPRPILADYIVAGEIEQAMSCYEAGHCQPSAVVSGAYEAEGYFPQLGHGGCWMYFTAAPLLGRDGEMLGAIETLQDITARKDAQAQLQQKNAALEDMVSARTAELAQRNAELVELLKTRCELESQVGMASSTAMTAMSSMGEMGVLLQVLQRFNACGDPGEVARVALETLAQYDLTGAVQIRMPGTVPRTLPEEARLEAATFDNLLDMGRIVNFHSRMIVNYPYLSVLVSNMPRDDADRAGRIRDNIAILAEAASARLAALETESGSRRRQDVIVGSLEGIRTVLASIESRQQQSLADTRLAIHTLGEQLEKLFVHLGLTEGQEEILLDTVRIYLDGLLDAQAGQTDFQVELSSIIRRLSEFS